MFRICFVGRTAKQVDTLRSAVQELRRWRSDYADILRALGFTAGLPVVEARGPKSKKGGDSDATSKGGRADNGAVKSGDPAATAMDVEDDTPRGGESKCGAKTKDGDGTDSKDGVAKITLQNLSACIHAAEKIAVGRSLREVREMRSVLQKVNDWIEQCQSLCPRRQSKRRVQPSNKPTFDRLQDFIAEGLSSSVGVADEVGRIRKHIAEALSWQLNAKSVLATVTRSFAEQTVERKEIWRKEREEEEEEEEKREKEEPAQKQSSEKPSTPSDAPSSPKKSQQASAEVKGAAEPEVAPLKKEDNGVKREGRTEAAEEQSSDSADDGNDREDELDEAEDGNGTSLQNLLTTARDISVFMPEELVTERVQRIMEWAR